MKASRILLAALAFAAVSAAHAREDGDGAPFPEFQLKSTKSRAEVIAEVQAARNEGTLYQRDGDPFPEQQLKGTKTRVEVRAELDQARERGELRTSEAFLFLPSEGESMASAKFAAK
jgi:hypothetical protein